MLSLNVLMVYLPLQVKIKLGDLFSLFKFGDFFLPESLEKDKAGVVEMLLWLLPREDLASAFPRLDLDSYLFMFQTFFSCNTIILSISRTGGGSYFMECVILWGCIFHSNKLS